MKVAQINMAGLEGTPQARPIEDERAFVEAEGTNWARPVAELLQQRFPAATRARVAQLLSEAAPECYEE